MHPSSHDDITSRLLQIITGWRGADRGQPLSDLHTECQQAAGVGGRYLVPAYFLSVKDLDETHLRLAILNANGRLRGTILRFRARILGRFDAALVPVGTSGEAPDRWLLAVEANLALRDQVALYGHAIGHLLLNRDRSKLGFLPDPDPSEGYTHREILSELRSEETVRQPIDLRVLQTYPSLAALLAIREEPEATLDLTTSELRQRLALYGWRGQTFVTSPYIFTAGRVYIRNTTSYRSRRHRVDALLRADVSLPMALVQTVHAGETHDEVALRLQAYAHQRMALPFAYLLAENGTIEEFDWSSSDEPVRTQLTEIPGREELIQRWTQALGLTDPAALDTLKYPYYLGDGKPPRYYQEAAINRAIIAVLQAKRQMRKPRILLTLATGTGKTKVAFQIAWKLKRTRAVSNILFITDRDYLLSQAMDIEFAPFAEGRTRIQGEIQTSRDIVFATYQAIADTRTSAGLFRRYPKNFFDVIIIDECHRGSAQEASSWRTILEYFETAVQIGLTATPLSNETVQTDEYFGKPLYTYSLRTGINDGFLAPYRVRHVLMGPKPADEQERISETIEPVEENVAAATSDEDESIAVQSSIDRNIIIETSATLLARTTIIAQHLARYMQQTDPMAKTIVFCVNQNHAEQMRKALEEACSEYVKRYPGYIERIVSDEGIDGKRALGRFTTPDEKRPVIVTTSRLLSTGVDIPTCKNIVLARPVGTMVEFKQIIGRGTRLYGSEKTWFTIIDYAGAIRLFFDPDFDGDPELVEVEPLVPESPQESDQTANNEGKRISSESSSTQPGATSPVVNRDHMSRAGATEPSPEPEEPGHEPTSIIPTPATPPVVKGDRGVYPPDQNPLLPPSSGFSPSVQPVAEHNKTGGKVDTTTQQEIRDTAPGAQPSLTVGEARPDGTLVLSPEAEPPIITKTTSSGMTIQVIGEQVYDLGPDGKTLRLRSSYRDYTATALQSLVRTAVDLRTRWLQKEQREALRARLEEEGVDLQALATKLNLTEVDPLDLLLHVAFGQRVLTRSERVERLYNEQKDFFNRFNSEAREILAVILAKYVNNEAKDVSDTEVFKVSPLVERGTFIELARAFGSGANVRAALKELQQLLYSA